MASSIARPGPVVVISIYYFCAAAFCGGLALAIRLFPQAHLDAVIPVGMFTYVDTGHHLVPDPLVPIVMPPIALYFAVIAWGLWRLQKWARHLAIITSGATAMLWLRAFPVRRWVFGERLFEDRLAEQTVFLLIAINVLIFCCLTMYPDVTKAFGDQSQ